MFCFFSVAIFKFQFYCEKVLKICKFLLYSLIVSMKSDLYILANRNRSKTDLCCGYVNVAMNNHIFFKTDRKKRNLFSLLLRNDVKTLLLFLPARFFKKKLSYFTEFFFYNLDFVLISLFKRCMLKAMSFSMD
jgi:hypothetical protein